MTPYRFTSKMNNMQYLEGQELINKINNLDNNDKNYVVFSRLSKEFNFKPCTKCKAPLIVHKDSEEKVCKNKPTELEIENIIKKLMDIEEIKKFGIVDAHDNPNNINKNYAKSRKSSMDELNENFSRKCSISYVKEDDKGNKSKSDEIPLDVFNVEEENKFDEDIKELEKIKKNLDPKREDYATLMVNISGQINQLRSFKYMEKQMKTNGSEVRIEKQRVCPSWSEKLKYELFKQQLQNWNSNNKHDESSKYYEVLESLKKNDKRPGLSEYMTGTVCEYFKDDPEPSVGKLIKLLDNKYLKSVFERITEFWDEIENFIVKDEKNPERFFEKVEKLTKTFKEEKLSKHVNFMFLCLMMKKGSSSNIFSETEYIMMKKILTDSNGDLHKDDEKLLKDAKDEFKGLKIEGKRSEEQSSHFTQNGRRNSFNQRPSRPKFKFIPSREKPDLWRHARSDQSWNRSDARSQSSGGRRFQPNSQNRGYFDFRDRSSSAASVKSTQREHSKSSERHMERKLDKILAGQETIKKRLDILEKARSNDVGFTESEEVDTGFFIDEVFFTTDEIKTSMIVDAGCPSTLSGRRILENYMKDNNLSYSELPTRDVNMIFKFGETKLNSKKSIDLPIKVKAVNKEGIAGVHYMAIPTYVVEGEAPFLLGLNTMEAWNAKLDMGAKKGLDINIENGTKQIKILAPKSGSHLKIGLQPLKEASLSTTVLYLQQEVLKVSEGCENTNEIAAKTINHEYLTRFHKGSGHKSEKNMMHALSQAEMVSPNTRRVVKDVISRCKECKKFGKSLPKPKTTVPKVSYHFLIVSLRDSYQSC